MFIADLHIHSHFSRATSRVLIPELLDWWARRKGIQVVGTGDFTHPGWRQELAEKLIPAEEGLYRLREDCRRLDGLPAGGEIPVRFMVTGEISSIYKWDGRVRKVHSLILLPGLEEAEALAQRLRQTNPPKEILIAPFDPANGCHAGPGALALFFEGDETVRLHP